MYEYSTGIQNADFKTPDQKLVLISPSYRTGKNFLLIELY